MNILEHSMAWAKGEQFEGVCIAIAGLATIVITFLLWKYGTTDNAKALQLPSFIIGILFVMLGSFMFYSNGNRQIAFQQAFGEDAQQFILSEKNRVEAFQFMYPTSLAISAICFVITLIVFVWSKNATFHAIGIVISVFGLALIIIDYFSKERATIYYEQILNYLQ
jgi:Ca2+/H+ antiporter